MRDADSTVQVTTGADQAALRRAHLGLVLRSLRDEGGRSRARLAADLGLTRAVASGLVGDLEARGLVCRGERRQGAVGRPGTTVELDGDLVCGVGAEVNVDHVATMAVDLTGRVVAEERLGLDTRRLAPEEVLDELAGLLHRMLDDVARDGRTVVALTVGVAGLVDAAHEVVTLAPNLRWRDLPVADLLRARLAPASFAVRVDNEANLAATAEIDPSDPDRADMLVVFGEVGVGGGVVADGRLRRGRRGFAGEFGHMIVDPQGRPCGCGRVGCWETVIGLPALLEGATDPDDPVRDPALTLEDRLALLAERARRGDTRTLSALHEVGSWLGTGAAVLVNALDPGVVVLSGYFAALGTWIRPAVEEQLATGVLAARVGDTRVVVSTLGPTAAVRGAALASLASVFLDPTAVPHRAETLNGAAR